jgi:hypothetical protein
MKKQSYLEKKREKQKSIRKLPPNQALKLTVASRVR